MILKDWMTKEGITQRDLAKVLETSASSLSNAVLGKGAISRIFALKIVEITSGKVSFEEAMLPSDFIEKSKNGSTQTRSVAKRKPLLSSDKFDLLDKVKNKKIRRPRGTVTLNSKLAEQLETKFSLYKEDAKKILSDLQTQIFILRKDVNQLKLEANNIHIHSSIKKAQ